MTLVSIPLMDRTGRRTLHLYGLGGMFIFSIFITISFLIKASTGVASIVCTPIDSLHSLHSRVGKYIRTLPALCILSGVLHFYLIPYLMISRGCRKYFLKLMLSHALLMYACVYKYLNIDIHILCMKLYSPRPKSKCKADHQKKKNSLKKRRETSEHTQTSHDSCPARISINYLCEICAIFEFITS